MTTGGWILMLSTWSAVIAVTIFCLRRLLKP
jgi:hypothetical protein